MRWAFDRDQGLIIVSAHVWGPGGRVSARPVLDTGAAATVLSPEHLLFAGYDPPSGPERVQLITASGTVYAPRFRVERIEALGRRRTDFPVVCHELPPGTGADGVLGLDFLRGRRLVVDFREGFVTLE